MDRGGGIFKNAAVRVLSEERRLMTTGKPAALLLFTVAYVLGFAIAA